MEEYYRARYDKKYCTDGEESAEILEKEFNLRPLIDLVGETQEEYRSFREKFYNLNYEKREPLFMEEKKDSIVEVLNKKLDDSLELYLQILIGLLTHYIKHKNDPLTVIEFEFWKSKLTWEQMYTISIYAFYSGKYDRLRELLIKSKLFDYFLRMGVTSRHSSFSHLQWFKEKAT